MHSLVSFHKFLGSLWISCALVAAGAIMASAQEQAPATHVAGQALARTATQALTATDFPDEAQAAGAAREIPLHIEPMGFFGEPGFIGRGIDFMNRTAGEGGRLNNGFYPEFSNTIRGSGWISIGPGYRQWLFNDRASADASAAISWRSYKVAQARLEFPDLAHGRLAIGSQVFWQDAMQVTYFGPGADSLDDTRSEFRMKTTDVVGYASVHLTEWLAIGGRLGRLARPSLLAPAGTFMRGNPFTKTVFPHDAAFGLADQPNYLHGELSLTADSRDSRSHPQSGGLYRAAMTTYSDRDAGAFSFRQYEAEAAQFVPLDNARFVLALHGWVVASDAAAGQQVPLYLMPSLGGNNTVRSYTDFRFHDRDLCVVNAETRFALVTHVDLAAFVDAGNVASRFSDLNFRKTAYGLGLRVHSNRATVGRLDVAHGTGGWQVIFRTSDPLHLSRLSRRTVAAPFVP